MLRVAGKSRMFLWGLMLSPWLVCLPAAAADFNLEQVLGYPYPSQLTAAPAGKALAWVLDERGVRNIWMAAAPDFAPRQLTRYTDDDGQELTNLAFSQDGGFLVFVRGGDHDANWPDALQPDPAALPKAAMVQIWSVAIKDGTVTLLGDGDLPSVAPDSKRVAFLHLPEQSVWWAPLDGSSKAQPLFFDRGHDADLQWSPDGQSLAFVSDRGDHSFVCIYRDEHTPVEYLAPSTARDGMPRWSPGGSRIAFVRQAGAGGEPEPILKQVPHPWSLWVAEVKSGSGARVWQSPYTLRGSYPETGGEANLHWLTGDRLLFLAETDNWPHLYSVSAGGGDAQLLTPGDFMVEDVALSPDHSRVIYTANTGTTSGDQDRRHIYVLPASGGAAQSVTSGDQIEWTPTFTGDGETLAFIQAGYQQPPLITVGTLSDRHWQTLGRDRIPADFPAASLVEPQPVSFKAADGMVVHGQIFMHPEDSARKPAIIFVHGGPVRQMLLGWHYMDYYSNAYAVNQYLASHGFIVLSVNYRLGIGYGHDFNYPSHWGPTGAAEYRDVLAGAHYLQEQPWVDGKRIGIWGGSYGGYLTALALARNSEVFKAGVDLHGVHDWSFDLAEWFAGDKPRYQEGDRKAAMKTAWLSSPDSAIKSWRSPVLLIQGDDDRNVHFHEMVDLVNRLERQHVPYEQLVLPDEIHGFLRYQSWLRADTATADYFRQQFLGAAP
jgi:dipeptidyl aminopeptidase/acylaminoacyl peptidase